ncbi:MAG: hypothetical protein NVSMB42_04590 [Herpetosiphon sp.]
MRVLVIGGAGFVGELVLPMLAQEHRLRIFDLRRPHDDYGEYVQGSLDDPAALRAACDGMDALVFMAMGSKKFEETGAISSNFDVNVKGVYLALFAAQQAGVGHAVYASSMSVYEEKLEDRFFPDEEFTPDGMHFYGLTKRLGEEVCRNAVRQWGMSINALRLCHPTPRDQWLATTRHGTPTIRTVDEDVAAAFLGALQFHGGFQAFMISVDYEQRIMNMSKAKRMLGWEPRARPVD